MPFLLVDGQKLPLDNIAFNEAEKIFEVKSRADIKGNVLKFDYKLKPNRENSEPQDYRLFHFFKKNYSQNDIFQVYEYERDTRIGWIFPLQSLLSADHDHAENEHFLRYAFAAFQKLLINPNNLYEFSTGVQEIYDISSLYDENSILLVLSNKKVHTDFALELYLPHLFKYGYYIVNKNDFESIIQSHSETRFTLKQIVSLFQDEGYIKELFQTLIYETHHLTKFHFLYQIIELFIEKILHYELALLSDKLKRKKVYTHEFKEKLNSFMSEDKRINKLFTEHVKDLDIDELQKKCNLLLRSIGKEEIEGKGIADSLYSVRNFIVHDYRNIPKQDIDTLKAINMQFEILIIDMLLNYFNPS